MRIDKFLWAIRFYKTRNIAAEAIKKNHVHINGVLAKPSKEVYGGDTLSIRKNQITYQLLVLDIPKSRVGAKLVPQYIKDQTPKEAFENQELLKLSKDYYRKKGTGRPTKKDRRDLEEFLDDED
ncbi:MAG TPA: RNA-binding S4 domain-containing protein [Flavobacteriales bacterium]|jgi:ribosome-associated heat shock protein Hsp15|nr:RNA-binding S4 domain-containing protein [Flavobacteriales bacterium]